MNDKNTPGNVRLNTWLGQLPEADGSAEHNKEPHPDGGYTYDDVPAWSESLVRAYAAEHVAADRERIIAALLAMNEENKMHHNYYGCLAKLMQDGRL